MKTVLNKEGNGYNVMDGQKVLAKNLTKIDALNFVVGKLNPDLPKVEPDPEQTNKGGDTENEPDSGDPEQTNEGGDEE